MCGRAVAKFHKKGKKGNPRKGGHHFRRIAATTSDVLIFGLAEKEAVPNSSKRMASTTFCLVLSGERRQEVGESHEYQNKTQPETLSSYINQ